MPNSPNTTGAQTLLQRMVMEDRFYWLTMELLSKIMGPFRGMGPGKE